MNTESVLDRAEMLDGYLAMCAASRINTEARAGQQYELFSDPDANLLATLAGTIPLATGAAIAILHPSADNGYPHTRPPNVICMPAGFLSKHGVHATRKTLLHEAIHLHQRKYPELWDTGVRADGWTRVSPAIIPYSYAERCRLNPDTLGPAAGLWAWESAHVPLPLYTTEYSPTLSDVEIKWLDLRNSKLFSAPPRSFTARYGAAPPQPEHPYELLAVEFSEKGVKTHDGIVSALNS